MEALVAKKYVEVEYVVEAYVAAKVVEVAKVKIEEEARKVPGRVSVFTAER